MGTSANYIISGKLISTIKLTTVGENTVANAALEITRETARGSARMVFELAAWNTVGDDLIANAQKDDFITLQANWLHMGLVSSQPVMQMHVRKLLQVTDAPLEPFMIGIITGNVATEVRTGNVGDKHVANFNLATNRGKEPNRDTVFYRLGAWNNLFDVASKYVTNRSPLQVTVSWLRPGVWNNEPTISADIDDLVLLGSNRSDADPSSHHIASTSAVVDVPF